MYILFENWTIKCIQVSLVKSIHNKNLAVAPDIVKTIIIVKYA